MFATGLVAMMMACDTSDSMTNPDRAIEDPTGAWALQAFQLSDGSSIPVPDPSSYTLDLGTVEAERAHIRADCNVCNGGYEVSGSTLTFGLMGCTLAACQPGSLERDYLFALGSASTYQRSGDSLALTYDDGVLQFQAR
jgi:heat shock protein HslJ